MLRNHPFYNQLWRAKEGEGATDRTKEIAAPAVTVIEVAYQRYVTELRHGGPPEDAFAKSMACHGGSADPVMLAFREYLLPESVDFAKLHSVDISDIAKNYALYEQVLGEFMPTRLSALVAPVLAELAFDEPTAETSRYGNDVREYLRRLDESRKLGGGKVGIPSGCQRLDDLMGGFGGTTIVGGNAGAGKTDFLVSCVASILAAMPEVAVLMVSADLSKQRMFDRLMCCLTQTTEAELYQGLSREEDAKRLERATALLDTATARFQIVQVDDSKSFDTNEVLRLRDGLIERSRCTRLLIVVDYLQVLRFDAPSGDLHESERYRFGELKRLTKPALRHKWLGEFPLAIISEVRKGDGKGGLELEDLSGTARHYYGADNVLLLEPKAEGGGSTAGGSVPITLSVKKARRGHKGHLDLTFDYSRHSFQFGSSKPEEGARIRRPRPGASSI